MTYQSINPNTGKVLKTFEHLTEVQLEKSLASADNCFQTWRHKSYSERAVIVNKAAFDALYTPTKQTVLKATADAEVRG